MISPNDKPEKKHGVKKARATLLSRNQKTVDEFFFYFVVVGLMKRQPTAKLGF